MSFVITFCSQKGGVGKSTAARMAAVAYAAAGWDTILLDADTDQMTSSRWMNRRPVERELEKLRSMAASGVTPLKRAITLDPDLVIVDGRPFASAETAGFARHSQLVIIPTGTALDDLNPAAQLASQLIKSHNVAPENIRFLLNHVGPKGKGVPEAIELLQEATGVQCLPAYLSERPSYRNALDDGKVPQECSHPVVKAEAQKVIAAISAAFEKVTA
ncbi:MAG: ParA family protein [Aeromonadaceae bacterium]